MEYYVVPTCTKDKGDQEDRDAEAKRNLVRNSYRGQRRDRRPNRYTSKGAQAMEHSYQYSCTEYKSQEDNNPRKKSELES